MRKFQALCEQYLGEADPIEINGLIGLCKQVEREAKKIATKVTIADVEQLKDGNAYFWREGCTRFIETETLTKESLSKGCPELLCPKCGKDARQVNNEFPYPGLASPKDFSPEDK